LLRAEVADALDEIADILDVLGDTYRPRAYRRAARSIENSSVDLVDCMENRELTSISGVGESIAKKIEEFIQTGEIHYLRQLREKVPRGVAELLEISDIGPKTALLLHEELGISSVPELEEAVKRKKLRSIKGMGPKTEENILRGIDLMRRGSSRTLLGRALPIAEEIKAGLDSLSSVKRISLAGSIRRMKETVGDVDILVTSDSSAEVMETFTSMPVVKTVVAEGETKSTVLLSDGLQVDIRIVPDDCFGSALQYFTGSKDHNIRVREIAQREKLKLSEYGLFDEDGKRVAGESEEEIYEYLGMSYVEPELRENTGEIEAAVDNQLPELIEADEIHGDFHVHSNWSDGKNTIEEIADMARELGYEYVCITDHSQKLKIANGLDEDRVVDQIQRIAELNEKREDGPRILAGLEVNILADGSLDMDSEVLEQLDVVIGSVHSGFKSDRNAMTDRLRECLSTGMIDILGHPTGRILGRREAYDFDEDVVFAEARDADTWMEINAFPDRLDLNDRLSRRAVEMGLKVAIGTDSHRIGQMANMKFGLAVARRAWLDAEDVINSRDSEQLVDILRAR